MYKVLPLGTDSRISAVWWATFIWDIGFKGGFRKENGLCAFKCYLKYNTFKLRKHEMSLNLYQFDYISIATFWQKKNEPFSYSSKQSDYLNSYILIWMSISIKALLQPSLVIEAQAWFKVSLPWTYHRGHAVPFAGNL